MISLTFKFHPNKTIILKDSSKNICFDRKLFGQHIEEDPDYHYPFLANDIIAMFIWFIAAG